eukprot:CAMPEP_0176231592 /NCGR_PEP_ID=MMETSP0121_2-20121125/24877_1 /TAXON_ID=160619 /ORGANISM="Kryptoperidinium foliaceum, Strain CCMP 1326" /LENGTH=51 /DNA_ID=CAMNT_0017570937 /DNA_START=103 /DNA_END=254 /DNA_ORIENTATION=-
MATSVKLVFASLLLAKPIHGAAQSLVSPIVAEPATAARKLRESRWIPGTWT